VLALGKKFEVDGSALYLKENEQRAFIKPSFSVSHLGDNTIDSLLAEKYTLKEINNILQEIKLQIDNTKLEAAVGEQNTISIHTESEEGALTISIQGSFKLESPKFTLEEAGIFSSAPQLSFEVDHENEDNVFTQLNETQSGAVADILHEFQERFVSLKTKWTQTFMEVDTSHTIMVSDLKAVNERLSAVKRKLTTLTNIHASSETSVKAQFAQVFAELQRISDTCITCSTSIQHVKQEHTSLMDSMHSSQDEHDVQLQTLQSSYSSLEAKMATADRCLKNLKNVLQSSFL
jgi:hypothetical protein